MPVAVRKVRPLLKVIQSARFALGTSHRVKLLHTMNWCVLRAALKEEVESEWRSV